MFDLPGRDLPSDSVALQGALEASVRRRIALPPGNEAVTLEMRSWPTGDRLRVNLSGGRIELPGDPVRLRQMVELELKPPVIRGPRQPGPSFTRFEVRGEPILVGPMVCRLAVDGSQVRFDFGNDADGSVVMAPAQGRGQVHASVPKQQLLEFVRMQARDAAREKGVELEDVQVDLQAPDPHSLKIFGTLRGHKKIGFLRAPFTVDFLARVEVDEALVGHVRQLDLRGHGMVMDALLGLLRPRLEQIKRDPIPIREVIGGFLPAALGLSNLEILAGQEISLSAEFGAPVGEGA